MTAFAPSARSRDEDSRHFEIPVAQPWTGDEDRSARLAADRTPSSATVRSPWRDPLFYLSFVAMALLFCAVGFVLLYRLVSHRRQV